MEQKQTNKFATVRNLSMSLLIVTVVSFSLILISTCIVAAIWIANAIETFEALPEWTQTYIVVASSFISITALAILILSIILAVCLFKDKQMNSVYLATCIMVWVFGLFTLIIKILNIASVATEDYIGWINVALYIVMVVMTSITYSRLNKAYKSK